MTLPAFGLLIIAALLHVGWNLLLKRAGGKTITLWWGFVFGSLIFMPLMLIHMPFPARVWLYALPSALCQAAYMGALGSAYQREDFSLVYPIARGAAPALLAVWAILFLKEIPSLSGFLGLGILTLGLMIVGSSKLWEKQSSRSSSFSGLGIAGLVAVIISFYSVIDGAAVKFTDALSYAILTSLLAAFFSAPVIYRLYGWQAIKQELRAIGSQQWRLVCSCLWLICWCWWCMGFLASATRERSAK